MFTIIRWIFSLAVLFLVIYLLVLGYKAIQKEGVSNIFSPVTDAVSELFSTAGMETTATTTKSILADFFTPKTVVAPLTVVPSQGWYENMDAIYKQIYMNNLNYYTQTASRTFDYDAYFRQYEQAATSTSVIQNSGDNKLQLLFPTPSTYMELRNRLNQYSK